MNENNEVYISKRDFTIGYLSGILTCVLFGIGIIICIS